MTLHYLIFDASDDSEGTGSWEAMASAPDGDPRLDRIRQEAQAVVDWMAQRAPGPRGPQDEGGDWDADIGTASDGGWTTVTLTLTGPWAWGETGLAACEGQGGPGVA